MTRCPNARELVRRLEDLLGRSQRWRDLVAVYDDVIARGDDELRIEALVKRARWSRMAFTTPARAVEAWREVVLASDSGETPAAERAYRDAVGELERLFRLRGQWHDLVDLIEARLGRTDDDDRDGGAPPAARRHLREPDPRSAGGDRSVPRGAARRASCGSAASTRSSAW